MTAPELRIMDDGTELAREAADLVVWLGGEAIAANGCFRVALSGGTTPRTLYGTLAGLNSSRRMDWSKAEFFFGDERCVPPDHPESNFRMAQETLFQPLKIGQQQIFRMPGEAPDPDGAARQYETVIRTQFETTAPAWPCFDLVLLGLGEDGHTASLFPGTPALDEKDRLVVSSQSPKGVKARLTLTVPAINRARTVVFLVSGAGKEAIVRSVLEGTKGEDRSLPATMIRPAQGRLIWFLDRAAAAGLTIAKQGMVSHEE